MPCNNQLTGHIQPLLKCLGVCYIHTKREPSVASWLVGIIAEPAYFGQGADMVFGVFEPRPVTIAWSCSVRRRWYRERQGHQHRHN